MNDFDKIDELLELPQWETRNSSKYEEREDSHIVTFDAHPYEFAFRYFEEFGGWFIRVGNFKNAPVPVEPLAQYLKVF